jgi:hypothetical protein
VPTGLASHREREREREIDTITACRTSSIELSSTGVGKDTQGLSYFARLLPTEYDTFIENKGLSVSRWSGSLCMTIVRSIPSSVLMVEEEKKRLCVYI